MNHKFICPCRRQRTVLTVHSRNLFIKSFLPSSSLHTVNKRPFPIAPSFIFYACHSLARLDGNHCTMSPLLTLTTKQKICLIGVYINSLLSKILCKLVRPLPLKICITCTLLSHFVLYQGPGIGFLLLYFVGSLPCELFEILALAFFIIYFTNR